MSFLGDDQHLVSSAGNAVAVWDLSQTSRLGGPTRVPVPWAAISNEPPTISFSPDGRTFVMVGGIGGIGVYHVHHGYTLLSRRDACPGDPIALVDRPDHGVWVGDLATGPDANGMQRLLDSGVPLATAVRAKAHRIVRRSTPG